MVLVLWGQYHTAVVAVMEEHGGHLSLANNPLVNRLVKPLANHLAKGPWALPTPFEHHHRCPSTEASRRRCGQRNKTQHVQQRMPTITGVTSLTIHPPGMTGLEGLL